MIPNQLLYILVGALFSAFSTLALSSYQDYKQSERTRKILYAEMESMRELLESMRDEDYDNRSVRTQIDDQVSTKMYEQHLPNLCRLTEEEIEPVISFYRRMNSIQDSHQTYNQMRDAETPDDKENQHQQSRKEWFSSYSVGITSEKALEDLKDAQEARERISFPRYLLLGLRSFPIATSDR